MSKSYGNTMPPFFAPKMQIALDDLQHAIANCGGTFAGYETINIDNTRGNGASSSGRNYDNELNAVRSKQGIYIVYPTKLQVVDTQDVLFIGNTLSEQYFYVRGRTGSIPRIIETCNENTNSFFRIYKHEYATGKIMLRYDMYVNQHSILCAVINSDRLDDIFLEFGLYSGLLV